MYKPGRISFLTYPRESLQLFKNNIDYECWGMRSAVTLISNGLSSEYNDIHI
jgi:hypothetical protein